MGVPLFIIATLLVFLMAIPALLHTAAGAVRWKGKWKYIERAFFNGAHALDVFANVAYASFLNDWFLRKGGYHYGKRGETISSATGRNWVMGRLTWIGLGLCGFLNWIDTDHCWKYIENRPAWYYKPSPVKWYYTASFAAVALLVIGSMVGFWIWVI